MLPCPESMAPAKKGKGGRPRKHHSEEERREANRQASNRYNHQTPKAAPASHPFVYVYAGAILQQPGSAPPTISALRIQTGEPTVPPDDDISFRLGDRNDASEALEPKPEPETTLEFGKGAEAEAAAALESLRLSPSLPSHPPR